MVESNGSPASSKKRRPEAGEPASFSIYFICIAVTESGNGWVLGGGSSGSFGVDPDSPLYVLNLLRHFKSFVHINVFEVLCFCCLPKKYGHFREPVYSFSKRK